MKKHLLFGLTAFALTFVTATVTSTSALAADMPHAWAGGLFGLAVPNASNTTSRGMYGLTVGAKLGDNLGIGAYYNTSSKDESGGSRFNYDLYGVQLSFHFDGDASGAWFGGRIGTSKVDTGTTYSPMNYGVVAGYDYLFAPHVSLGGELNWMTIASASSSNTNLSSFSTLDFLLALKFWF